jgi:hypothetical protein
MARGTPVGVLKYTMQIGIKIIGHVATIGPNAVKSIRGKSTKQPFLKKPF